MSAVSATLEEAQAIMAEEDQSTRPLSERARLANALVSACSANRSNEETIGHLEAQVAQLRVALSGMEQRFVAERDAHVETQRVAEHAAKDANELSTLLEQARTEISDLRELLGAKR
jgi:hypothetical protein